MRANRETIALVIVLALMVGTVWSARAEPNAALYELQERCGKLAAQVFDKEYNSGKPNRDGDKMNYFNYQAHYNARLNKCFFLEMSIFIDKQTSMNGLRLFDLLENKEYGAFTQGSPSGIIECRMQKSVCRSEDEWHQLAKQYLEE